MDSFANPSAPSVPCAIDGEASLGGGRDVLAPCVDGEPRASALPLSRASDRPGMSFGHDVLLALIMAVAMAATVFLYR